MVHLHTFCFHIDSDIVERLLVIFEPTHAVDSDAAGSTKEARACTKKRPMLFLEGFGY